MATFSIYANGLETQTGPLIRDRVYWTIDITGADNNVLAISATYQMYCGVVTSIKVRNPASYYDYAQSRDVTNGGVGVRMYRGYYNNGDYTYKLDASDARSASATYSKSIPANTWTTVVTFSFNYTISEANKSTLQELLFSIDGRFEYSYTYQGATYSDLMGGFSNSVHLFPVVWTFYIDSGKQQSATKQIPHWRLYYQDQYTWEDNHLTKKFPLKANALTKSGMRFVKWETVTHQSSVPNEYVDKDSLSSFNIDFWNELRSLSVQGVWRSLPTLTDLAVERYDSASQVADDMGDSLRCSMNWSIDSGLTVSSLVVSCGSVSQRVSTQGSSGSSTAILAVSADPLQPYTVNAVITDSDSYNASSQKTSTTEYTAPAITSASVERVDDQGDLSDDGEHMSYDVSWRVANIGSQTEPVSLLVQVYSDSAMTTLVYSETITTFTPTASGVVATGTNSNPLVSITGGFSTEDLYYARFTLTDNAGKTAVVNSTLPIAYFPFDILRGGHGAAFGKPSKTAELLDVGYGINSDVGYLVGGEQAYPTFIRTGWSESSDESTLPVTPCFVLNPTNSAYYYCDSTTITRINPNDYLPLSGGTLAGPLHVAMQAGSWIQMRDFSKAAIDVDTQIDTSGNTFRPIMLGKFTDGHWWGFGGINKRLGFYYWLSTRTANGNDGSVEFDPVNGKMYAGGTELSKVGHTHNASDITAGTLPDARLSSGNSYVSLNSTYIKGGSIELKKRGNTVQLNGSITAKVALSGRPTIGTIPSGYRPAATCYVHMNDGPTNYLICNTSGSVVYSGSLAANSSYWFSSCYVL